MRGTYPVVLLAIALPSSLVLSCSDDEDGVVGAGGSDTTGSTSTGSTSTGSTSTGTAGGGTGGGGTGGGLGGNAEGGGGGNGGGAGGAPACLSYTSQEEESSPIQTTGSGLPSGHGLVSWSRPAAYVYLGAFSGTPNNPASHEGVDYVHDNASVTTVPVNAAADGQVVYVRLGCPQSTEFSHNNALRECGAGWGNHVVVDHGNHIVTRYAHLKPAGTVVHVGNVVSRGQPLGLMGNTGRSEVRHLHLELGSNAATLDPCDHAQSFDYVYDSEQLSWQ